jgi:uncharacterized protein YaaQ
MKLVVAVVQARDADAVVTTLTQHGLGATLAESAGGFLREGNMTLLMGVEDGQVPAVMQVIDANCHTRTRFVNPLLPIVHQDDLAADGPVEVEVGGAAVFVLPMARFVRL